MRASIGRTMLGGGLLAAAVAVVIAVSSGLDLRIEPTVLAGVLAGAVVGLVPDRSPLERLAGFAGGVIAAEIGFALRALSLPDTDSGRAVGAVVTVLLATAVAAFSSGRVPLWAPLAGAGVFAAVYEAAYAVAPAEMVSTSGDALTALALSSAVGFVVVGAVTSLARRPRAELLVPAPRTESDLTTVRFDKESAR